MMANQEQLIIDQLSGAVKPSLSSISVATGLSVESIETFLLDLLHSFFSGGANKEGVEFDPEQLKAGIEEEMEHSDNTIIAEKIAKDHLAEDQKYYERLERINTKDSEGRIEQQENFRGIFIAIEQPVGSIREGKKIDGTSWRTEFLYPYGFINNTDGEDNEEIDCFIGPNEMAPDVFIIHQMANDEYDEDKVMFGFDSEEAARDAYLAHFDTQGHLGEITTIPFTEFKVMLDDTGEIS